jgi:hypothetical protein
MTYNDIVEYYDYVCNTVQTLEGGYLYLHRTLTNGIEKSLIDGALEGTNRSSLSIRELSGLALVNPKKVNDPCITPEFLSYAQTFGDRYHDLSLNRTLRVHPAQVLEDNPDYRTQMFDLLIHEMYGENLADDEGLQEFVQIIETESLHNIKNRSSQQQQQQQQRRRRRSQSRARRPRDSVPLLIDSPDDIKEPASKRPKSSC